LISDLIYDFIFSRILFVKIIITSKGHNNFLLNPRAYIPRVCNWHLVTFHYLQISLSIFVNNT